jgi:ribose transport system permease protein
VTAMETTTPSQSRRAAQGERSARLTRVLAGAWIYLALLIVIVAFSIWGGSDFLAVSNFKDVLYNSSAIALLAIGSAFLIISGQLDLSLGSVLVFSSVVGAKVMGALSGTAAQHATGQYPHATRGIVAGIVVCILCGAAWGFFNGLVVTRWRMPSFIVTLGTLGMALGLAEVITKGTNVSTIPPQIQSAVGSRELAGIPLLVIVSAVIALVAGIMLAKTRFGLATYAIGSNNEGARRAGLDVERHLLKLFVLAGTLAGLAGAYDVARFNTTSVAGHTTDALTAIAAVVIGGASLFGGSGTIALTAVGVLIPAVLDNGFVIVNVQPFWADVAIGAVLIIAVGIDQARRRALATRH